MKRIFLILIAVIFINQAAGCSASADTAVPKPQKTDCVKVYYFHGFFRCSNCYKIEKYSREAIDKYFAKELASGELIYEVINTDEKDNEHFLKDYKLYTKSLIISRIKGGEEIEYKNLEKVWNYLGDKEAFYNYVEEEVIKFLEADK
ncbi:MAG: nitrophenyl compound nitroreductase subunit ArsF family protein [Candidatus Omnitrophota bacterium]|nr:nitrophenyl compound nitroreductase subunit ArsF family protein [Candidatus Omnitrophota bacterium]